MVKVTIYLNDNSEAHEECDKVVVHLLLNRITLMSKGYKHMFNSKEVKMIELT